MVNWKSKYLEMKLKYINAKNKFQGGMNLTEEVANTERFGHYINLSPDIRNIIQKNALEKILERKAKLTRTDNDIRKAANTWSKNPIDAEQKYGHISDWNTSNVTDMHQLFDNNINFNEDISKWDTSNVTNMNYMFSNASDFNQDISEWNVSKVTTMIAMFKDATNFKQDLNKWNPTNLDSVFSGNLNYTFRNTNKKFKIPDWYKKATAY